eukprot:TRINITY_DN34352_c0_g1_i1.p1 TRINITY_DN34352_c0_g1~~TRINITY_DN34352_c0_g1_i1.p1  ORF type:complete len:432 (+),score=110.44 TRINITY_DN34352_c0_g1_i1:117-1412(+)
MRCRIVYYAAADCGREAACGKAQLLAWATPACSFGLLTLSLLFSVPGCGPVVAAGVQTAAVDKVPGSRAVVSAHSPPLRHAAFAVTGGSLLLPVDIDPHARPLAAAAAALSARSRSSAQPAAPAAPAANAAGSTTELRREEGRQLVEPSKPQLTAVPRPLRSTPETAALAQLRAQADYLVESLAGAALSLKGVMRSSLEHVGGVSTGPMLNGFLLLLLVFTALMNSAVVVFLLSERQLHLDTSANCPTMVEASQGGKGPSPAAAAFADRRASRSSIGAPSDTSETSAQFNLRLEEITAQLAAMLRGPAQVVNAPAASSAEGEWRYIAAVTDSEVAKKGDKNFAWQKGTLGFWVSQEAFTKGSAAVDRVPFLDIDDVEQQDGYSCVVIRLCEGSRTPLIVLKFRAEKEATLWASTLSALLEQLEEEGGERSE